MPFRTAKIVRWSACVLLACGALSPWSAAAQAPCRPMGIEEIYDSLIPAVSTASARLSGMNVIVRYIPGDTSVDRELKIELTRTNGSTRMTVWAPAGRSIYGQLRELRQSRPDQCDDVLMRAIQIQRGSKEGEAIDRSYKRLERLRVPAAVEAGIYLDAPRFEIILKGPMNRAQYSLYGNDTALRRNPLVAWAKALTELARGETK